MKGKTGIFLALLLALIAPDTCRAAAAPLSQELTVGTTTPFDGNFFTQMWGNSVTDLDVRTLLHGYDLVEWDAAEGVFRFDPSVVSGAAVTEDSREDRTYVLTICQDLFYCDGTPITAEDYVFSFLLSVSPEMAGLGAGSKNPEYIKGCRSYMEGDTPCLTGVRLLDTHTLSVTVSHEYLPYFYELELLDCTPVPIDVIAPGCRVADEGEGVYITNEDETLGKPLFTEELLRRTILDGDTGYLSHPSVTSGPYRLLSFDGETAEFEINPYYKGNSRGERPSIDHLTYKTMPGERLVDALAKGEVGLISRCVNADVIRKGTDLVQGKLKAAQQQKSLTTAVGGFSMSSYPRNGLSFFSFCCEQEPVDSIRVRQAVACCLDKDALVDEYVGGYGLRADGCYGIGQWMYKLMQQELDDLTVYDLDVEKASELLEQDGWIWNEEGERFDGTRDDVRCKKQKDRYVPLELNLVIPEGNTVVSCLDTVFGAHLAKAGVRLTIRTLPMDEVLDLYYRRKERSCQMIYLASNFDIVFDPSESFKPDTGTEKGIRQYNTTALSDDRLYELAVQLRRTKPGDVEGYCRKWLAFQERFTELLPMIPVYSNAYFDFFTRELQDYNITSSLNWGQAVIHAYLSDPGDPR